jgi:hypothetical protein
VHFEPRPADGSEPAFWSGTAANCRLRIETRLALKAIEFRLENRSGSEALHATVSLFDGPAAGRALAPGALEKLALDRPRYKKIGTRFGYQFDVRVRPASAGAVPAWGLAFTLR